MHPAVVEVSYIIPYFIEYIILCNLGSAWEILLLGLEVDMCMGGKIPTQPGNFVYFYVRVWPTPTLATHTYTHTHTHTEREREKQQGAVYRMVRASCTPTTYWPPHRLSIHATDILRQFDPPGGAAFDRSQLL